MARALLSCVCAQSAQKGEGRIRSLLSVALVHRRYAPRRTLGHCSLLLPPCCPLANYQVILSSFKPVPSLLSCGRWKSDTFSFYWSLPLFFTPPTGLSSKNMYTCHSSVIIFPCWPQCHWITAPPYSLALKTFLGLGVTDLLKIPFSFLLNEISTLPRVQALWTTFPKGCVSFLRCVKE